jgi:hypothetical protein
LIEWDSIAAAAAVCPTAFILNPIHLLRHRVDRQTICPSDAGYQRFDMIPIEIGTHDSATFFIPVHLSGIAIQNDSVWIDGAARSIRILHIWYEEVFHARSVKINAADAPSVPRPVDFLGNRVSR